MFSEIVIPVGWIGFRVDPGVRPKLQGVGIFVFVNLYLQSNVVNAQATGGLIYCTEPRIIASNHLSCRGKDS